MNKTDAFKIVEFIENHYDMVSQDEYFDLCDMLLDIIVKSANQKKYGAELAAKFPYMFGTK